MCLWYKASMLFWRIVNSGLPVGKTYQDLQSKKEGKIQESIQSSITPDPGYKWESNNVTIRHYKREPRGQPFPTRHQQTDVQESITKQDRNNIKDPQKKLCLGTVSKKYITGGLKPVKWCTNLTLSSDVDQDTYMFGLHESP